MRGIILVISVFALLVLAGCAAEFEIPEEVVCTEEARLCPGGSYVTRNPELDCEFDPCLDVPCFGIAPDTGEFYEPNCTYEWNVRKGGWDSSIEGDYTVKQFVVISAYRRSGSILVWEDSSGEHCDCADETTLQAPPYSSDHGCEIVSEYLSDDARFNGCLE